MPSRASSTTATTSCTTPVKKRRSCSPRTTSKSTSRSPSSKSNKNPMLVGTNSSRKGKRSKKKRTTSIKQGLISPIIIQTTRPADLFYAQMNAEEVPGQSSLPLYSPICCERNKVDSADDDDSNFATHSRSSSFCGPPTTKNSFAYLGNAIDMMMEDHRASSPTKKVLKQKKSRPIPPHLYTSVQHHSSTSTPISSYVPPAPLVGSTSGSDERVVHVIEADMDDASVISEMTEFTHHGGGGIPLVSPTGRESDDSEGWDEELCPSVDRCDTEKDDDFTVMSSGTGSIQTRRSILVKPHKNDKKNGNSTTKVAAGAAVAFSHVEVRIYEAILDINPSVSSGPAIGIGWRYKQGPHLDMTQWEEWQQITSSTKTNQEPRSSKRGLHSSCVVLSRRGREERLRRIGYSQKAIAESLRIIRKAKHRRKVTVQNLPVEDAVKSASRKLKGLVRVPFSGR